MHYGHPDVFDRIFHVTRGGISKASRVINISEDIFAGKFHNIGLISMVYHYIDCYCSQCTICNFSERLCDTSILIIVCNDYQTLGLLRGTWFL